MSNIKYLIATITICGVVSNAVANQYGTYDQEEIPDTVVVDEPIAAPTDPRMYDTSDPMYMLSIEEILSETTLNFSEDVLRAGQYLSYGINNRLTIGANIHYQVDFSGPEDGFSSIDLGGKYRMTRATDTDSHIISDVLFGFKFAGSSHVRTPWFADSQYYAGLRIGRQWAGVTLAGTIKSNWIFDKTRGMSYIDFIPEIYFRLNPDWRIGFDATIRKSTNPDYDQEWVNFKLVRQYGRTQYIGHVGYEFENENVLFGLKLNILF